jgi:hypothetical protein
VNKRSAEWLRTLALAESSKASISKNFQSSEENIW